MATKLVSGGMDEAPPERLGPYARAGLVALGLAALAAAVPAAFLAWVMGMTAIGGWHGVTPGPDDWAVGLSLIGLPFLLLALAVLSLRCTTRRRARLVAALAAAVVADTALAIVSLDRASRLDPPSSGITRYRDEETARKAYGWPPEGANAAQGGNAPLR